jgi:hypothetical protein
MPESSKPKEESKATPEPLTLAAAAKLVKKDLKDCLAFKDYGDVVIVVTVDGQKLQAAKNAKA